MRYGDVVEVSARVAATPKRSEKVAQLAGLLRRAASEPGAQDADQVRALVGMLVGEPRQGRIGVGWATLRDARVPPAPDTGQGARPDEVSVRELDEALGRLATTSGPGSQRAREELLRALLARMTEAEQAHLVRLLNGELRQGANDGVVSDAIASAAGVPTADLRRATMLLGDLGAAAALALAGEDLDVGLIPLVAVKPMLAATSTSVTAAMEEVGPASVEWKLDGIRLQVHRAGDDVRLFTRGLNDITTSLPHVVQLVRSLPVRSFVADGESLGIEEDGRPRRFQDTMHHLSGGGGATGGGPTTQAFLFDVLHVDGTSLIDEPLSERKRILTELLPPAVVMPSIETVDAEEAERFALASTEAGHEGVMVKALDSAYHAGRRGASWRKVKPVHTLDLVVLAAEWGHGRRTGWLSNLHLGARDATGAFGGGFVMVGKTFKGMTDELLRWQTEALQAIALGSEGITVHVRPELVVEIAIDGVQVSRRYPGGVALRFARVKRYRPERSAADADTIERVRGFL